MKGFIWLGVILVIMLAIGAGIWGMYNSLVTKEQAIEGQWAQVETQYQRRYDLIPNLVNSVKGYMTQEKTIFEDIANARSRYAGATTTDEKAIASGEVEGALARLLAIMENYPNLRSIEAITNLMDELAGTENRISVERRRYNEIVLDYNTAIKTFPRNMLAGMFGFSAHEYFESVTGADEVPKVEF
jgi:LemA protein